MSRDLLLTFISKFIHGILPLYQLKGGTGNADHPCCQLRSFVFDTCCIMYRLCWLDYWFWLCFCCDKIFCFLELGRWELYIALLFLYVSLFAGGRQCLWRVSCLPPFDYCASEDFYYIVIIVCQISLIWFFACSFYQISQFFYSEARQGWCFCCCFFTRFILDWISWASDT